MPAAPPPPAATGDLPPRVAAAIAASVAAIAGRPVDEADPAAHRAVTVIRAIQAHAQAPAVEG